jgi:aspartyl-tRNA(Asn)/glutamyl-tRNA(Gln) amidotransferase subunit B
MDYVTTIGLEVHVQLKTRSKMFCSCRVEFGAAPNVHTCPICLGFPGALPVMNYEALRMTILTGLMLGCDIAPVSKFDRKNYFYPDVAKNYQITQYDQPLCSRGRVPLHAEAYPKDSRKNLPSLQNDVPLLRIHLEEDVAKSFHFETSTGIDFNRAGTPLMEIVTQPEIKSSEEAFAFLTALKQILIYGGVSDAEMEKGQLRCDCNVSVRRSDQQPLGAKVEIKNMNSISGVRSALAFEAKRQTTALSRGEPVLQETRGWDDNAGSTFLLRTKESAHDYRYFPDPDLVPVHTHLLVAEARARVPELPEAKRIRFVTQYQISAYDAGVLASDVELADYFERAAVGARAPKQVANWVLNELRSVLAATTCDISDSPVQPRALLELLDLIDTGQVSGKQAKDVFAEMFASGKSAGEIVQQRGLHVVSDPTVLAALCDQVIAAHPSAADDFRAGNPASLNFLKGQVMKLSNGTADPALVGEIIKRRLAA